MQVPSWAMVYTDGSCIRNGRNNPKAGWACYWGPGHMWNKSGKIEGKQTNNVAEFTAVLEAIKEAQRKHIQTLALYTDSSNGWRTMKGTAVQNAELIKEIDGLLTKTNVIFSFVEAHKGDKWNEAVDKMAKEAALKEEKVYHFISFDNRFDYIGGILGFKVIFYKYAYGRQWLRRNVFLKALRTEVNGAYKEGLLDNIYESFAGKRCFNFSDFLVAAILIKREENYQPEKSFLDNSDRGVVQSPDLIYQLYRYHNVYRRQVTQSVKLMLKMAGIQ